uniref:Amine oxidase n=1 Tax=Platynereis dumerilii TaxID=6359 RepID=A0A097EU59_PLADU|nr:monoamine oxidase [Platynereis dumerilii]
MATDSCDVIVIGAGISGLSAAKLLNEKGVKVIVLEARDRVGGRTYTRRDSSYKYCDVGGSYVGPTQDRIVRLAAELGIKTYKINNTGDYVHFSKGKGTRFQGTWPKFWNPFSWLDVNHLFRKMDQLMEEIPVEQPWNSPHAEEWDNKTMKEFYDETCWTEAAKEFGVAFVNTNVTMEPSEVSMLWFLWYVKSCGTSRRIWEVDNGGQERKFVGGSMQVSEKIADILGSKLKFNEAVYKVSQKEDKVTVECASGKKYAGKYVIMAMSPTLQQKLLYDPPMPPIRSQLIQRVPMGSCIKNYVMYKRPFWREKGMNGFTSAADGIEPVGNTVDDCKPDNTVPALTGFIMGDQARRLSVMTREERYKETLECYARIFGTDEAFDSVGYEEHNWVADPYSGGCYTSTYPPGVMTRFGKEIRKPFGRMFFAGTETAVLWTGYMDGAVEAGERAARESLNAMGMLPEDQIWQVEPMSQDVPTRPLKISTWESVAPSVDSIVRLTSTVAFGALLGYTAMKHQHALSRLFDRFQ